eukprot:5773632-Pyramimonas_sp.AAC.1
MCAATPWVSQDTTAFSRALYFSWVRRWARRFRQSFVVDFLARSPVAGSLTGGEGPAPEQANPPTDPGLH